MEFSTDMTVQCAGCDRRDRFHLKVTDWDGFTVQQAFIEASAYFESKGWIKTSQNTWECPWHNDAARRAA